MLWAGTWSRPERQNTGKALRSKEIARKVRKKELIDPPALPPEPYYVDVELTRLKTINNYIIKSLIASPHYVIKPPMIDPPSFWILYNILFYLSFLSTFNSSSLFTFTLFIFSFFFPFSHNHFDSHVHPHSLGFHLPFFLSLEFFFLILTISDAFPRSFPSWVFSIERFLIHFVVLFLLSRPFVSHVLFWPLSLIFAYSLLVFEWLI